MYVTKQRIHERFDLYTALVPGYTITFELICAEGDGLVKYPAIKLGRYADLRGGHDTVL